MKALVTLATLAALTAGSLRAQAQFTVDGTLGANELGTGVGKYQLAGTYVGAHSVADRGLKAVYVGTTATTLNIMVVASPEQLPSGGYSALVLYLAVPNRTGIAAGTRLPGSSNTSSQLRHKPTLDMPVDYGFRITMSQLGNGDNNIYLSRVDYTVPALPAGTYAEIGMGQGQKNGTVTTDSNDPALMRTAYQTSVSGSVTANTTTGWEFEVPLAAVGGAAAGSLVQMMAAYVNDDASFTSDVLPQIAGQTAALGVDPNFSTIAGNQFFTYQVGLGVLSSRAANAALPASAYPNPVAADSRVVYTVTTPNQAVSVEAYNTLGQRVATLLEPTTQSAGQYSVGLAPLQGLAAGVYMVRVRAGEALTTQRVVVR